jgi:hypothetical protein
MSPTHFLPPSTLLSPFYLHLPPTPPPHRWFSLALSPASLASPTGGGRRSLCGRQAVPPPSPRAFPVPCSLPTPAALHVPCSLPTPAAELRPSPPRGARPPSNRWRVRRIQDWIDTVAARRQGTPSSRNGCEGRHICTARSSSSLPSAGGGSSTRERWRIVPRSAVARDLAQGRRPSSPSPTRSNSSSGRSRWRRLLPLSPAAATVGLTPCAPRVDIVGAIFLSICCLGLLSLLSVMARTATTERQVGPGGA